MSDPSVSVWSSFPVWTRLGILCSNHGSKRSYFFIFRFFSLFQTLLLITDNIQRNKSHDQNFIHLLKTGLQTFLEEPFFSHIWTVLSVIAMYFCGIFLMLSFVVFQLNKESIINSKYTKFFGLATTFHSEVLFYLFNRCFCELLKNLNNEISEASQKRNKFSLILVLLCLNVILTFCKIIFCYSRIRTKKFVCRKGSFHLMGTATLQFLLPIFQSFNTYSKSQEGLKFEILSITTSLVVSICILLYIYIIIPEYDLMSSKMHIVFYNIIIVVCVGQIVDILIENDGASWFVIFCVLPLWVKLNLNAFDLLIKRLKFFQQNISNHYHYLHLEKIYKDLDFSLTYNISTKRFSSEFFEVNWLYNHTFQKLPSKSRSGNETLDAIKMSKIYVRGHYQNLLNMNPKSMLISLSYAKFLINHFSFFSKAYHLCAQASKQRISIPDNISIFHIMNKIEAGLNRMESRSDSTNGALKATHKIFQHEVDLQSLKSQMDKYIEHSILFWKILHQDKPDFLILVRHAKQIEKHSVVLDTAWKRYASGFSGGFSLGHFLYGVFQAQVLNRPWEGAQYIEKYNSFTQNKKPHLCSKIDFSNEYGVIMISGDRKNLGEIEYCSDKISEIFLIEKKSLLKKNVNIIMPKFFQEKHSLFLLNQYDNGENKILWKKRLLYGKDLNNNIFPISLILDVHLDLKKGIIYTATIKKISDKNEYILFRDDGIIDETSVSIGQICGIEAYKKVSINSICLDFDFEDYKKSFLNNQPDEDLYNGRKISIKVRDLGLFLKIYKKEGLDRDFRNHNLGDLLRYVVNIKRFSYYNEVLNVMILEFKSDAQSRIRELNSRLEAGTSNKKNIENVTVTKMLTTTSKSNILHKTNLYNSTTGNTEYENPNKILDNPSDQELITSSYSNQIESDNMGLRKLGSMENENFNVSLPTIRNNSIDSLYRDLSKPHPNRFKNVIINLLILVLIVFFSMIVLQYIDLEVSIEGLKFEIGAIKTTYDRLTSLSLIAWYASAYQVRLNGLLKVNVSDLDRFKLRIRTKRNDLKVLNDDLMNGMAAGQEYQQQTFFQRDISVTYENISNIIYQRKMNSFEVIHVFIEKLIEFDATPHDILRQNGNPDLKFVKNNLMNDLLISSEGIVESVQDSFLNDINHKRTRMSTILFMNIVTGWLAVVLVLIVFYVNHRLNTRLARTLASIHPQNIDLMISKLIFFANLLRKKEKFLPKSLYYFYQHYTLSSSSKLRNSKLSKTDYRMRRILIAKIKQFFLLILLICGLSAVSSIRYISSNTLLDEALVTNNQIIFVAKTRHMLILSFATLLDLVENLNTTKARNLPIDTQLIRNIDQLPLSTVVFQKFIDADGQFMDFSVATLLKGKPCSLVIDFPGGLNSINCPTVTQNEAIGILAVYSYAHEELYSLSERIIRNLTVENTKDMFAYMTSYSAPKINTLNGSFMFLIDFLSQKIDGQILYLLEDAKTKLIWQLILITFLSFVMLWFLIRTIFDDLEIRILLKIVPFEEIDKNKLLKQFIKDLYRKRIDIFE